MKTALHVHFWADIRNNAMSVEKIITALAANGQSYRHQIACCVSGHNSGKTDFDLTPFEHNGAMAFPFCEDRWRNKLLNKILGLGVFTYSGLVRIIEEKRPDVLHFHNRQEQVDAVLKRLSYRPGVVVHYHNHFKQPVEPCSPCTLLFLSQASLDYFKGVMPLNNRHRLLGNPLSLEIMTLGPFPPKAQSLPAVLLYGGGNNPIKGLEELLAAFARLPPGRAHLVMAGAKWEQRPPLDIPGVEVVGPLAAADYFKRVEQADVVLMPSHYEPFGLIAQEAMYLKRLVLVSTGGALAEFTDDSCSFTVAPKDAESLYHGLMRALDMLGTPQADALIERAFERVQDFHPVNVVRQLEAIYDEALSQGT